MDNRIEMTALISAVPGQADKLEQVIQSLVEQTLLEVGCIEFQVFRDLDDAQQFILWEIFEDQRALQDHLQQDYTQDYFSSGLAETTRVIKHRKI